MLCPHPHTQHRKALKRMDKGKALSVGGISFPSTPGRNGAVGEVGAVGDSGIGGDLLQQGPGLHGSRCLTWKGPA